MISCPKWIDVESPDGGKCGLNARTRSFGVCRHCPDNTDPCEHPPGGSRDAAGNRLSSGAVWKPCGCGKKGVPATTFDQTTQRVIGD
jgi:hypothetical protein